MNKRCIVNVATGDFYCKMQSRLITSFALSVDKVSVNGSPNIKLWSDRESQIDLLLWRDTLPKGSRPHSESPYGFKVHAIKAAYEMGYTSILWLDSPAYAVKEDISPIFENIEKEGYYAMSHIDPLENWVGDAALNWIKLNRSDLLGNLPSGSCYGFDMRNSIGRNIFLAMLEAEYNNVFKSELIDEGKWHRHDESVLALILLESKLPIFTFDPLFQSDSPECVIKSGGE